MNTLGFGVAVAALYALMYGVTRIRAKRDRAPAAIARPPELRSVPVSAPTNGVARIAESEQHQAQGQHDDADRDQDRQLRQQQPQNDEGNAENDHGGGLPDEGRYQT